MRPTVSEQLVGLRQVLADVVSPLVTDAYAADVLAGALDVLDVLAEGWADVPGFLRWDSAATVDVLRLAGVDAPSAPADPLDLGALQAHHREVRGLLEETAPTVLAHEEARAAAVQLFRERAERYPLATRPRGGFAAHAAR